MELNGIGYSKNKKIPYTEAYRMQISLSRILSPDQNGSNNGQSNNRENCSYCCCRFFKKIIPHDSFVCIKVIKKSFLTTRMCRSYKISLCFLIVLVVKETGSQIEYIIATHQLTPALICQSLKALSWKLHFSTVACSMLSTR